MLNHADAENVAGILNNLIQQNERGSDRGPSGAVTIQADKTLNAIVLRADPSDMNELLNIVQRLDTPRSQVLIEAAIVEISLTDNKSFSVESAGLDARGKSVPLISTSLGGSLNSVLGSLANQDGNVGQNALAGISSITQPTVAAAKVDIDGVSFGAVISALASLENANLLSTPSIVTLDNTEAKILVGQEVPFRSGSFTTSSDGANNPFTTVTREDVGIELTVTPHVYDTDEVRMEVAQNISNVLNNTVSNSTFADVVTSKRSIETTVLAASGETIVLGGLIQDDTNDSQRKVPVLGDIPVLGNLFKSKSKRQTKTNLVVFLRPTVIDSAGTAKALTDLKLNGIWEVGGRDGESANVDELFRSQTPSR
jgi:general secretion pathway protein D